MRTQQFHISVWGGGGGGVFLTNLDQSNEIICLDTTKASWQYNTNYKEVNYYTNIHNIFITRTTIIFSSFFMVTYLMKQNTYM